MDEWKLYFFPRYIGAPSPSHDHKKTLPHNKFRHCYITVFPCDQPSAYQKNIGFEPTIQTICVIHTAVLDD